MSLTSSAAPSGQTCYQWAGEFTDYMGGYLNNPNATEDCEFCQYRVGDSFYNGLEMSYNTRWRDFGIYVSVTAPATIKLIVWHRSRSACST
jgi:ATP-binding cassette subfamily G (WHITE) protein 2 (SNQ2)